MSRQLGQRTPEASLVFHVVRTLLASGIFFTSLLPVSAHSELRGSMPSAHARLDSSPAEIVLNFKEQVQVTTLRLLDAAGRVVRLSVNGDMTPCLEARARVPSDLRPGHYKIDWAALSGDGHPISGTVSFEVRLSQAR